MFAYWSVAAVALASMTAVSLVEFPLRTKLQNLVFDEYQRWRPRVDIADLPVRVVDVDDESIRRLGQWPWPRAKLAEMLRAIESARPAAIALDLLFSEPERSANASGDDDLAKAIAEGPVVLGDILTNSVHADAVPKLAGFAVAGDDPLPFAPHFRGLMTALPALRQGAAGIGFMNWLPDYDRVVRSVPLVISVGGELHPSLAMEALRVAQGATTYLIKSSNASGETAFGEKTGIVSVRNGDVVIATDPTGGLRIDYAEDEDLKVLSAWQALERGANLADLEGKIVLVGVGASLLSDIVATPLRTDEPGINVHAQVLEQALAGVRLVRPDWAPGAEWLVGLVVCVGLVVALPRVPIWLCGIFGLFAVSAFVVVSLWAFTNLGLLLDPLMPTFTSTVCYLSGVVALYGLKRREEQEMRSAFGRYVSPAVVARLARQPETLQLGGEQRDLTVMFCDLRSFTTLSEGLSAVELRQFLNDYLTPMTDAVLETSGTVDKYIGDAIMAFWNAPLDDPDHARNAVEAALQMRKRLVAFNAFWREETARKNRKYSEVKFGIGLNTGECCVGNLGSNRRFDYSAIGDEVNVASRLEGSSKAFGVDIVASESTRALTAGFAWLEVDRVLLKNKTRPVGVYTLAGDAAFARSEAFATLARAHAEMLADYRDRNFSRAAEAAASARGLAPPELRGLYDFYVARLVMLADTALPDEWLPILKLEEK